MYPVSPKPGTDRQVGVEDVISPKRSICLGYPIRTYNFGTPVRRNGFQVVQFTIRIDFCGRFTCAL